MAYTNNTITLKITTIHTITTMHRENQQQLPTIFSKAINLIRQINLNTTKTNLLTTRRIWMPRDEFEYHELDLNTTLRVWIPQDGFKYHETDLDTTRRIEYHETDLNTTKWICIPRGGFKYHEANLNTTRRFEYHETNLIPRGNTGRGCATFDPHYKQQWTLSK